MCVEGTDMSTPKVKSFMDSPLVAWVSGLYGGEVSFIHVLIPTRAQHSNHPIFPLLSLSSVGYHTTSHFQPCVFWEC